ncbi:hypothetical protein EMCRGX_G021281 [Ephydatia muelleri]
MLFDKMFRRLNKASLVRLAATMSTSQLLNGAASKLQFPALPKELVDRYKPGQMFQHQRALPKLPVPPLQQTLNKYITSVQPLLSAEDLERTKHIVHEFGRSGGIGEVLQQALVQRANTQENWLSDWWLHAAYMGYRLPVTVHSSPAIGYSQQAVPDLDSFVNLAARYILATEKWNLLVQLEAVPPDVYRNKPMSDTLRRTSIQHSRHIVVIHNEHFYKLDLLYETPTGELAVAPASHLVQQLKAIVVSDVEPCKFPVGLLTTEHRDTWYQAREKLNKDPVNHTSLETIETAQFVVCLDRPHPNLHTGLANQHDSYTTFIANRCLHGSGSRYNSGNRWFDSSIQLIVGKDGGCGTMLEHGSADGPAAISINIFTLQLMFKYKYDFFSEKSSVDPALLKPASKLSWNISALTAQDIENAKKNVDSLVADVDLQTFIFTDFGKNVPKQLKLSPDGFIQNAIQLAYYKLHGKPTAMYETGATRWFKYGRTDTIRSTTNASFSFVKTMCDPIASAQQKVQALQQAVHAHTEYTNDAISGDAVDRHLLGLRLLAKEAGMETPEIFKDPAYGKSVHFCLSTSQVPVESLPIFLCFGAVVEDGYGICYNPQEERLYISVSSFRHCPHTDSVLFAKKLTESLREMKDIFRTVQPITSKL